MQLKQLTIWKFEIVFNYKHADSQSAKHADQKLKRPHPTPAKRDES